MKRVTVEVTQAMLDQWKGNARTAIQMAVEVAMGEKCDFITCGQACCASGNYKLPGYVTTWYERNESGQQVKPIRFTIRKEE